jgi:hypothetical protein
VAPIDISAVRHERESRRGHHMLAHLRTEAYPVYSTHRYPPSPSDVLSYERNLELIRIAKGRACHDDLTRSTQSPQEIAKKK